MKKIAIISALAIFFSHTALAADVNLQELDSQSRMQNPNTNSIMFRRNAEQYRRLSDEDRKEIAEQREENKRIYLEKEEMARRRAMEEMQRRQAEEERRRMIEEEERRRAEALKPITLFENKLKIYALVNGEVITSSDM